MSILEVLNTGAAVVSALASVIGTYFTVRAANRAATPSTPTRGTPEDNDELMECPWRFALAA